MKRFLALLLAAATSFAAPVPNRVLLPVETIGTGATGGRKDLPLLLTPGTAIVGATGNLPAVTDIATQTELNAKASLTSPVFTGTPSGPTAASGTNNSQLATTAFTDAALSLRGKLVTTAAQLTTAAASGGTILYRGAINVTVPTTLVAGTKLYGISSPGIPAKITYPWVAGQDHSIFLIAGAGVEIYNLEMTTGFPVNDAFPLTAVAATDLFSDNAHGLVAGNRIAFTGLTGGAGLSEATSSYYVIASGLTANAFKVSTTSGGASVDFTTDISAGAWVHWEIDTAIRLSDDVGVDNSGLVVEGCNIHDVWVGIMRSGGNQENSEVLTGGRIVNNNIHNFHWGVYLDYNTNKLLIDNNHLRGIDAGSSGAALGNAIWLGDSDYPIVSRNHCSFLERIAIELVLDPTNPAGVANGNFNPQIINNDVSDCIFGISVVGNGRILIAGNNLLRAKGIGIEAMNSIVSFGEYDISINSIVDTGAHVGQTTPTTAISANSLIKALIHGNTITRVTSPGVLDSMGIQLFGGGVHVDIKGNVFTDAGSKALYFNGEAFAMTASAATDLIADVAHGLVAADQVVFPALTGGAGLTQGSTVYYVIATGLTVDAFSVSITVGGAAVDITTDVTAGRWSRYAWTRLMAEGNTFYYSADYAATYPPPLTYWPAISVQDVGVAVIRNNTVWSPAATPSFGLLQLDGSGGTVYSGITGTAPITAPGTIAETNLRVTY